jgi:hypothetical protein
MAMTYQKKKHERNEKQRLTGVKKTHTHTLMYYSPYEYEQTGRRGEMG